MRLTGLYSARKGRIRGVEERLRELLGQAIQWAIDIDPAEVRGTLLRLERARPGLTGEELAQAVIEHARRRTAAVGVSTGLPGNLLLSSGVAMAEAAVVLRSQAMMVAQIGECLRPGFLNRPEARFELLVPLMGAGPTADALRRHGVACRPHELTHNAACRHLRDGRGRALGDWLVRGYARYLARKTGLTKLMPVIGGVLGGGWNYAETWAAGRRALEYFGA
jgi:hypothetical protein